MHFLSGVISAPQYMHRFSSNSRLLPFEVPTDHNHCGMFPTCSCISFLKNALIMQARSWRRIQLFPNDGRSSLRSVRHVSSCRIMKRMLAKRGIGARIVKTYQFDLRLAQQGSGPGGQKINKVRNCVQLTHRPTGISVSCQDSRELTANRHIARKRLVEKVRLDPSRSRSKLSLHRAIS